MGRHVAGAGRAQPGPDPAVTGHEVDPVTGAANPVEPLPATPALRRFSIDRNRLAWVSPPGQDGQESSLQILGWNGDQFGEIETEPAPGLSIVN